jgi:hypothetical protein
MCSISGLQGQGMGAGFDGVLLPGDWLMLCALCTVKQEGAIRTDADWQVVHTVVALQVAGHDVA